MPKPARPSFPRRRQRDFSNIDQLEIPGLLAPVAPEGGVFDPPPLNDDTGDDPEDNGEFEGQMARLTEVPTKSTNPPRPRTRAAGYDSATRTLSVVFRDGTPWNYYDVSPLEAANFRRATSKGRFIRLYLDAKRNGPPKDNGYRFTDARPDGSQS